MNKHQTLSLFAMALAFIPATRALGQNVLIKAPASAYDASQAVPPPQRELGEIRSEIGCTDEEFAALSPLIQKVIELQLDYAKGRLRITAAVSNQPAALPVQLTAPANQTAKPQPQTEQQFVRDELQAALDNPGTSAETLAAKLSAYRAARGKAQEDIRQAQNALKQLLTQKQEGILVMRGLLR